MPILIKGQGKHIVFNFFLGAQKPNLYMSGP